MRHFVLASAIRPGARGMVAATAKAALITPTSGALFSAPRSRGASLLAVDVAAIAAAADQHLLAAARTEIEALSCMRVFSLSTEA